MHWQVLAKATVISLTVVLLSGCGIYRDIEVNKNFPPPQNNDLQLMPESGRGKEIITKGDGKEVLTNTINFGTFDDTIRGTSENFEIIVRHIPFDELAEDYGVPIQVSHPIDSKGYQAYHSTGEFDSPVYRTYYKSENNYPYQEVTVVPFYTPKKPNIYRSENNEKIYKDFLSDFANGKIQPMTILGDKRIPREIRDQMSDVIGQPYYDKYFANTSMFYVRIENKGDDKIRLWPRDDSVLINELNQQYGPLPKADVDEEYEIWKKFVTEWNLNYLDKPSMGVFLSEKETGGLFITSVLEGGPAHKNGVKKGSKIIELDGKSIYNAENFNKIIAYKDVNDEVTVKVEEENEIKNEYKFKLVDGSTFAKKDTIKILDGGNIYPQVAYDGYLLFRAVGANVAGSKFRLIIPLIAADFNAADVPFRSYELELIFVNKNRRQ